VLFGEWHRIPPEKYGSSPSFGPGLSLSTIG
jgi:hypothetical protein